MMRWLVNLTGTKADLDRLVEWPDGKDWQIIRHEKRGVVLCGPRFEAEDNYEEVGLIAEKLISFINHSAKHQASDFQGVSRAHIIEQCPGRDHVIVPIGLAVEIDTAASISWVKRGPNGSIIETSADRDRKERADGFQWLVALQEANPDLAEALRYLEEEPNMYGFYKVGEAILRAIGKPKKWEALVDLGWTSDGELRRFTRSTHAVRHHRHDGLDKPMTLREAEGYIRDLLKKLILHLEGERKD